MDKLSVEIDSNYPDGVFIGGVFIKGEIIDGKLVRHNTLERAASTPMTEEQSIVYNYHLALKMEETFLLRRPWWEVAKSDYDKLQNETINGKRRVKGV